jgi:hypothetical protein
MPVKKKSSIKLAPVSVRLLPATKAALEKAAIADERPISVMAQKIIADWLKANGFLKWAPRYRRAWQALARPVVSVHYLRGDEDGFRMDRADWWWG